MSTFSVRGSERELRVDSQSSVITPASDSCYCLEEILSDIYAPTAAQFTVDSDGKETMFVVEQRGIIKSWRGGKVEVFMDIRDRVHVTDGMGDSRGLLSAVLSPEFPRDGMIYVYYIRQVDGKDYAYVSRFHAVNGKVDTSTEQFLLRVFQPFEHGNGGPMLFGDDGFLYIMTGDGGAQDDVLGHAQNKNSFHGSVLRIDPRLGQGFTKGESAVAKLYSVPENNPFRNVTDAKEEIFAIGFRNPWGCSVDSQNLGGDGRIYCIDTGTDKFDEVNVIENGKNYGWNIKEGLACRDTPAVCGAIENEGLPISEFKHETTHALVGGFVYRGSHLTWMKEKGYYTFADILSGQTYYLEENKTTGIWQRHAWSRCEVNSCPSGARDKPLQHLFAFAQDIKGEIYFLMVNSMTVTKPEGKMYKVRAARGSSMRFQGSWFTQTVIVFLILSIETIRKNQWAII